MTSRTPITRLRLRAEEIEPECLRREVIHDLDTMRDMVHSALSLLRGQSATMRLVRTDLSNLIQTLCDGFCDMGHKVEFIGPLHVEMNCDPERLSRALANLIDNGVKFANPVTVELNSSSRAIVVEVKDDGPGISDADKDTQWSRSLAAKPHWRPTGPRALGLDFQSPAPSPRTMVERRSCATPRPRASLRG
jgi:signal transduction histidine kinase